MSAPCAFGFPAEPSSGAEIGAAAFWTRFGHREPSSSEHEDPTLAERHGSPSGSAGGMDPFTSARAARDGGSRTSYRLMISDVVAVDDKLTGRLFRMGSPRSRPSFRLLQSCYARVHFRVRVAEGVSSTGIDTIRATISARSPPDDARSSAERRRPHSPALSVNPGTRGHLTGRRPFAAAYLHNQRRVAGR